MAEPISTASSTLYMALKAGSLGSLLVLMIGDVNLLMTVIVGLTGGIAFFFKELAHLDKETRANTNKWKIATEFMHMIPMSIAMAGIVIFLGVESTDYSNFVWWFFGLFASLNYKHIVSFIGLTAKQLSTTFIEDILPVLAEKWKGIMK